MDAYVSTGHLPSPEQVRLAIDEAYEKFRTVTEGAPSHVYPAPARVPVDLFGICAAGTRGGRYAAGDADHGFTIMSVAKPFVFALVCEQLGAETMRQRLGVNATGLSRFAGRPLETDQQTYASASATNHRNRALADLLPTYGMLGCDPMEAVGLYMRQSGVNPITRERVVESPGKGALSTVAPPLDRYGNSVRGQLAARYLATRLGLTLFASEPAS